MIRRLVAIGAVVALGFAGGVARADEPAPPAQGTWAAVQVGVDYTVYQPTVTFGLPRSTVTTVPCNGLDDMATGTYGVEGKPAGWINLQQSQRGGCVDGTDGIATYTTFPVKGGIATVKGECTEGTACTSSTAAGVRKYAYTYVTIPAPGSFGKTFVAVYTAHLSLKQIKRFVRGLTPAAG